MELTSTSFLVTLIAVTALAMLAALLLWNRIPGPGWVRWPARVLMIGLCQLTSIAVIATWINGSYGLYSSWNDLLGTENVQNSSAMTGPPLGRAKFTQGGDGTQTAYFRGSHSKLAGQVIVWTPPEYRAPGAEKRRFPVLMLLHGYPGSPRTWIDLGNMPGALEQLVRLGAAHPFILVIPEIYPGGVNTDCSNTPTRKVAGWLAEDVPDLVAKNFRTLREPSGWGCWACRPGRSARPSCRCSTRRCSGRARLWTRTRWPGTRRCWPTRPCASATAPVAGPAGQTGRRRAVPGHLGAGQGQPAAAAGGLQPGRGGQRGPREDPRPPGRRPQLPDLDRDVPGGAGLAEHGARAARRRAVATARPGGPAGTRRCCR